MDTLSFTSEEQLWLLSSAREAISAHLSGRTPQDTPPSESLHVSCGVFVTLHTDHRLRGCIGRMTGSGPLYQAVKEMAISSATGDPRFPRLALDELNRTVVEISVLSPLEEIDDVSIIEVGVHGIYLTNGTRSGVLLPQVAVEQGWSREEFLINTCRKAGLPADAWKSSSSSISIFSAMVISE